jgi:hypothetical protein
MPTAGDIINGSLRLIGVLAEGETPSAPTAQDALTALNEMLDSWGTERLAVYATQTQVVTWPAGQQTRTFGPTGNIVGARPVRVDDATYYRDPASNISYALTLINQAQYNLIALKTAASTFPQMLWVNMTYPDIEMYIYPVPTQNLSFHLVSVQPLSQPALLNTDLAFPPGYLRAFRYNLATELAPEFGVNPSNQVIRIAMTSKRNLKRINNPNDVMFLPYDFPGALRHFNVFTGR